MREKPGQHHSVSPSTLGPLNIGQEFLDEVWEASADEILEYFEQTPGLLPLVSFEGEIVEPTADSLEILVRDSWSSASKKLEISVLIAALYIDRTIAEYEPAYQAGDLADGVTPLDVALVSYRYGPDSTLAFALDGNLAVGDPPISQDLNEWLSFGGGG